MPNDIDIQTTVMTPSSTIDFGVKYTPHDSRTGASINRDVSLASLEELGIKLIRVQWVDFSNHIHCRVLPLPYFRKICQTSRRGVSVARAVFGIVFLTLATGPGPVGEYLLVIDMASLRRCGYAPGHAAVFGYFQEKLPIAGSVDVSLCPRTNLKRILEYAEIELKTRFLVGFESELILLTSTKPIQTGNSYGWSKTAAFLTGTSETKVLEEIADALECGGVELQMFHSEAAPGQYEIITGPLPPLEAADALVHTRETIFNIASKHGLRATFAPRLHADSCGSGAHTHISVHPTTGSSPASHAYPSLLTTRESHFLAGLLAHLPAVIALTLPLPQSYARMIDGVWSGGTWVAWGVDHREVPVRLANAQAPHARNFEIKSVDGTASPYLVLAGLLAAGVIGIRDEMELREQNCTGKMAAEMSEAERTAMGITKRLPLDIESARARLVGDAELTAVMGEEVVQNYVAVNKTLARLMLPPGEDEDVTVARLVETY